MTSPEPVDKSDLGGLKLIAIGDVHLGTRPSSLPDDLESMGVSASDLTPEAALAAAVDLAISKHVDAVLFAGDVVESTNARFEALRPLESALQRLLNAGIQVLAVVGNHDVEALPRLAGRIEGLSILGSGGQWESCVIEKNGHPAAEVLGWSFPERQVKRSPVAELIQSPLTPKYPGLPQLGILHADLGASGGVYAPVSRQELLNAGVDVWLLGHIHKPSLSDSLERRDSTPHGYLGSLVGLDPGEVGPHGPWIVTVAGGRVGAEHIVNSPLRWERIDVGVDECEDIEDTADRILDEVERLVRAIQGEGHSPRLLGVRVRLVGRTQNFEVLQKYVAGEQWRQLRRDVSSTVAFVDKLYNHTTLAIDLEELAQSQDPPALLARKILSLTRRDEDGIKLIEAARADMKTLAGDANWSPLNDTRDARDPMEDDALAETLIDAGTAALYAALPQRPADQGGSGGKE